MGRVFAVRPKRIKRTNGQVLTPEMEITVTTKSYTFDPFYNGAKEIQEQYMRMYHKYDAVIVLVFIDVSFGDL